MISRQAREALELLIEAVLTAEYIDSKKAAEVLSFPEHR
ncbi:hypothetical protein SAMN05518861_10452 [Mesorhizobium sp. YR577]|nr:hypothetical protein SAMN05518861_10452 [Mesorhizobium sp. YR577]